MKKVNDTPINGRREFLATTGKLAGTAMVLAIPGVTSAGKVWGLQANLTVQDVIDLILKEVPNARTQNTVDKIRSGSADQVTKIITTIFHKLM